MDLDKIRKEAFAAGHAHGYCAAKLSGNENWIQLYEKWNSEEPLITHDVSVPLCRYKNCTKKADGDGEMWCTYHDLQING